MGSAYVSYACEEKEDNLRPVESWPTMACLVLPKSDSLGETDLFEGRRRKLVMVTHSGKLHTIKPTYPFHRCTHGRCFLEMRSHEPL